MAQQVLLLVIAAMAVAMAEAMAAVDAGLEAVPVSPSYPTSSPDPSRGASQRPHIIFILADDLGFNDVGFRGSDQIPTPNIDALAYGGLVLDRYYVAPVCTPTRAALLTGKHPIHTGMQHATLYAAEPRGLPLSETLLPEHLRRLGYATHLVGKWHLGNFRREYTPTMRGFDSHLGFWTGHQDYYDHTAVEDKYWGLDMRRGMEPAWDLHGQYSTELFTREAERLVGAHNASRPMFLLLAHAAVHSANPYSPLQAPDATVERFDAIRNFKRRKFAAMLTELDNSVGRVVAALSRANMLSNSIIIFSTDNGGPAAEFNRNMASNWPLRGVKNTLWEGGVRGVGVMWAPETLRPGRLAPQMLHVTDWMPTLYRAAGGHLSDLGDLDGYDAWDALTRDTQSPRTTVLHNIDEINKVASITVGQWKMMQGTTYGGEWDRWYGPSGRGPGTQPYDLGQVLGSRAARALRQLGRPLIPALARELRAAASAVRCLRQDPLVQPPPDLQDGLAPCEPLKAPCLFNIVNDPCEMDNLADRLPALLRYMQHQLAQANATAVPAANLPLDPRADPRFWDHTWTNFGDYSEYRNAVS